MATLCMVVLVAIVGVLLAYSSSRLWHRKPGSLSTGLDEYRGLTELIVLNIGLSLGVISPYFTMLVIMALVTTL